MGTVGPRPLPVWFWLDSSSCYDRFCVAIGNHSSEQPRVCDSPFCEPRWICGTSCCPSLLLSSLSPFLFVSSCPPSSSSFHPSFLPYELGLQNAMYMFMKCFVAPDDTQYCDYGRTSTYYAVHLDPWSHVAEKPPTYHTSSLFWSGHQQELPNWMDTGNLKKN